MVKNKTKVTLVTGNTSVYVCDGAELAVDIDRLLGRMRVTPELNLRDQELYARMLEFLEQLQVLIKK